MEIDWSDGGLPWKFRRFCTQHILCSFVDDGVDEESTTEEETEPEAPIKPEVIPAPVEVTETPAEPEIIESQPAESQIEETPAEPEIPETVPEITPESTDSNLEEEATSLKEGQVLGDRATITCPGAVDTTCSAFAALEILVTAGSCSGTASADCRVQFLFTFDVQTFFLDDFRAFWMFPNHNSLHGN
ncbi:hypothetical protein [Pyruvatibacter sp.]